jgi:hypothetical protein
VKRSRSTLFHSAWFGVFASCLAAALSGRAHAQALSALPDAPQPQPQSTESDDDRVTLHGTPLRILKDQEAIWTSPVRLRAHDLEWGIPLLLATGAAIATDHQAMNAASHDRTFNHENVFASDVLVGGFIAAPLLLFGKGQFHDDPHAREAGILGSESILDGVVVEQGMKLIFWRERPSADSGRGRFFQSSAGIDSSFPSSHTVLTWSSAAVLAEEYPSPWKQFGIYTAATGVSLTRVLGQQHFPSDVLVGSAAGWLVGHYVYKHHHRYEARHGHLNAASR